MNVSAIIVTRGDCDLSPILDALPLEWEILVWHNGGRLQGFRLGKDAPFDLLSKEAPDLGVYGRYAAIEHASHDLIYVQDDDCIVGDPQAIVDRFEKDYWGLVDEDAEDNFVVCNMPHDFRHDFYVDHSLVGFGAAFHRDAPERAFRRFSSTHATITTPLEDDDTGSIPKFIQRTCDIVFTALTPRVLVDVPYENLPHAYADGRMYRQQGHQSERSRMLELVRKVLND